MTLVALSSYQRGRFAFIGDVNAEDPSMQIIKVLGSFLSRKEDNIIRRKSFLHVLMQNNQCQSMHVV